MGLNAVLLALLVTRLGAIITNFTGSLNGLTATQQLSFAVNSAYSVLSIQFQVSNAAYSNVVVYVSFNSSVPNLTLPLLASYLASSSSILSYMDPISAIGGSPQNINLWIPSNATTYYVTFFNFDLPEVNTSKNFYLATSMSNTIKICQRCASGSTIPPSLSNPLSCQCVPCADGYVGKACKYQLRTLTKGKSTLSITNDDNQYFQIAAGESFSFSVQETSNTGAVYLYLQYQYNTSLLAGKINNYYLNSTSLSYVLNDTIISVNAPAVGLPLLLTFRNFASSIAAVSITYGQSSSISYLPIIIGVCIGAFALIIIIILAYRLRKRWMRGSAGSANAVVNASEAVMKDDASLTEDEVNKYFPQVSAAEVLPGCEINPSSSDINLGESFEQELAIECSICFDTLKRSELIRVTYCRHLFHGKCLLEWFRKNQICPNCRQVFDYETTKRFRSQLPKKAKATPIALVRAILGNMLQEYKATLRPTAAQMKLAEKEMYQQQRVQQQMHHQEQQQQSGQTSMVG